MTQPASPLLPAAGIYLALPPPDFAPATSDTERRTFRGLAYSGEPLDYYGQRIIIDLESLVPDAVQPTTPVLLDHEREDRIGHCTFQVQDQQLLTSGQLLSNETAAEVARDADEGFPFQLSIYAQPGRVEEIQSGTSTTVNERSLSGPLLIMREVRIRELSFTPTGVDAGTSAQVLALSLQPEDPMATPQAPAAAPTAAPTPDPVQLATDLAAMTARAEAAELQLAQRVPADLAADLQRQVADLTTRLATRERADLLQAALSDGRLLADTPLYAHAAALALEPLRGLLASLTPIPALGGTQTQGQTPAGASAFNPTLAAEFGDQATYDAFRRAEAAGRVRINPRGEE